MKRVREQGRNDAVVVSSLRSVGRYVRAGASESVNGSGGGSQELGMWQRGLCSA